MSGRLYESHGDNLGVLGSTSLSQIEYRQILRVLRHDDVVSGLRVIELPVPSKKPDSHFLRPTYKTSKQVSDYVNDVMKDIGYDLRVHEINGEDLFEGLDLNLLRSTSPY